jgi:coenzyme F420-dependent glucose-6-phosphate dehydrogenase
MVKFGFSPEILCHDVRDNLRRVPVLEEAGFDDLWEGDHTLPWHHRAGYTASLLVTLEAYLAHTQAITIGSMVLAPIGIRRQPIDVALDFATMALLHPGRVALGIGTGEAMNEKSSTGVWPSTRERIERLEEAVEVIRKVWDSPDFFHHRGKYFNTFFYLYTRPEGRIPIYCAANGPIVARLAGRLAEGHIAVGVPPSYYADVLIPAFEAGAREAGKDPANLERCAWVSTAFHPDRERALDYARLYAGLLIPECYTYIQDPRVIDARGRLIKDEALEEAFCIATTPEQVVDRFEQFIRAGCDHIIWADMSPDTDLVAEICRSEIVPHLKRKFGAGAVPAEAAIR